MKSPRLARVHFVIALFGLAAAAAQAQDRTQDRMGDLYAGIKTVEVFANMAMQVTPAQSSRYQLAIYRLDAMQNVEALVNKGLPQTEAAAQRWIAENEPRLRRQLQPMIASAVNGMSLAHRYQIDRLPAIVINRRYVVYGYAEVDQALVALRSQAPSPTNKPKKE